MNRFKIKKKQVFYAVPTNDAFAHFGLTPRNAVHIEKKNFLQVWKTILKKSLTAQHRHYNL